jgi:hypothetical protein
LANLSGGVRLSGGRNLSAGIFDHIHGHLWTPAAAGLHSSVYVRSVAADMRGE